jgi:coenzyme PQQ synthesis protein D (PqqD)
MPEKYIARSSAVAARALGGEMMVMSTIDSTFFTLNEVAAVIWQSADGRTPLSDIVSNRICAEFDVNEAQAQLDAECFVDELSKHGILVVSDRPLQDSPPPVANQ